MSLRFVVGIAFRAIGKNKLRSWLTVLGMVIGIAALTATVSVSQSATALVRDQLERAGTNVLVVVAEPQLRPSQVDMLTVADTRAIARECPAVRATSPFVVLTRPVVYSRFNRRPQTLGGVGVDYLSIRNWPLSGGEFFTEREVRSAAKVCVVGQTIVKQLFRGENPLSKFIRIGNIPFRVVGVLESKGANLIGQDRDDIVLVPYTTARKRLHGTGFDKVDLIVLSARSSEETDIASSQLERLLNQRHKVPPDQPARFRVTDMKEYEEVLEITMSSLTLTLATVAGISLLVGGIGIMNIMLVSVTERTREIGLRMAVGADGWDILRQFLVEAVVLSCLGGLVGVVLGVAASVSLIQLINRFLPNADLPVTVSLSAATVALMFAAAVGIFFGFFPARRASQLDPIEALRYE